MSAILIVIVKVLYAMICVLMILVVLLQAGRGGMGTALGGGASQSVFGGSGGADFLARLTQGLAAGFMSCALILAYTSSHSGSKRLREKSEALATDDKAAEDAPVDDARLGPNPLPLPDAPSPPPADRPA
jgi:preprotein translocase subunit SecG